MSVDKPTKPVSRVSKKYIDKVQSRNKTPLLKIGDFDMESLGEFFNLINEDTLGDIELLCMPYTEIGAGLLVAKYDGNNYIALAGIATHTTDAEDPASIQDQIDSEGCRRHHRQKEGAEFPYYWKEKEY